MWTEKQLFMRGIWLLQHLHGCPRCNFVDWCGGVVKARVSTWSFAERWILTTGHTWDMLQGVGILPCALQPLQVFAALSGLWCRCTVLSPSNRHGLAWQFGTVKCVDKQSHSAVLVCQNCGRAVSRGLHWVYLAGKPDLYMLWDS